MSLSWGNGRGIEDGFRAILFQLCLHVDGVWRQLKFFVDSIIRNFR